MEVMLEIYRTLKTLGWEWREKLPVQREIVEDRGRGAEDMAERQRQMMKKDQAADEKAAQELFFVETRCRINDVIVSISSSAR